MKIFLCCTLPYAVCCAMNGTDSRLMAKINSTYGSGYYIPDDFNPQPTRKRPRDDVDDPRGGQTGPNATIRQTMMLEFTLQCEKCEKVIGRGTKFYMYRRKNGEKYLGEPIYELSFKCNRCSADLVIKTDPEHRRASGGYVCVRGCRRVTAENFDRKDEPEETVDEEAGTATGDDASDALQATMEAHRKAALEGEQIGALVDAMVDRSKTITKEQLQEAIAKRDAERQQALAAEESAYKLAIKMEFEKAQAERKATQTAVQAKPITASVKSPSSLMKAAVQFALPGTGQSGTALSAMLPPPKQPPLASSSTPRPSTTTTVTATTAPVAPARPAASLLSSLAADYDDDDEAA